MTAPHSPPTSKLPRVLIVGGGLAGMAAAAALESAGCQVTLLEARRALGGRASSFVDPQSGEELDNCQHVLLGCCTNLIDFYRRTGSLDLITFERTIHFRDPRGRYDLTGLPGLPAPLHLSKSMLGFGALTPSERSFVIRAMLAMMHLGREGRKRLADRTFGQWLDDHRQPAALAGKFYDPILISALNEDTRRCSAEYAIEVFQDSLLANSAGYLLGLPNCPLGKLYSNLPCKDVRLGQRVNEIRFERNISGAWRVAGVELAGGETLQADAYVLATNHHAVQKWIPTEQAGRDERFAGLERIESVPILGAHLWFDRPVLRESHAALIEGPLQWLFRKDKKGQVLHGVISAARDWLNRDKDESLKQFEMQIRRTLPDAREAKLLRGVIVIEKRATFSPLPGIDRLRPSQSPPRAGLANLYLAGDYTQTGWPATMEGAVRAGYLAAESIMSRAGSPTVFIQPDLPLQWPARLFASTGE